MKNHSDVIAAIATPPGEGGVAIVRLSGSGAFLVADKIFSGAGAKPSARDHGTICHGRIIQDGQVIDEVLLLIMKSPHSYTKEDVVEIQCHGGNVIARRILRCALEAGARSADPGEFTRRAFLNGRIDLLQAEAVLDLVRAQSDRAAKSAIEQLEGSLSRNFEIIYDELLSITADIEALLDFPEDELPVSPLDKLIKNLKDTEMCIKNLLNSWSEGHLLREGAIVVISGRPNVGKSTMLNTLLGSHRAIVSNIPGTTRDTIEEQIIIDGIQVRLVDTAGLRETKCEIEQEGVKRTRSQLKKADLQIYIIDASVRLDSEDLKILEDLNPQKTIVVLNKIDLGKKTYPENFHDFTIIETSLVKREGLGHLKKAIKDKIEAGIDMHAPPHAVISERHRKLLSSAGRELSSAVKQLEDQGEPAIVFAVSKLRMAIEHIGLITGKTYSEDLLSVIFSKFCIGK